VARFDLYRPKRGPGLLLDVQASWHEALPSRVVVPLLPPSAALPPLSGLNPVLLVQGAPLALMTHFLAAVPRSELGRSVGSLAHEQDAITRALDLLFSGF
jgi:toxin CcdB